MVLVCLSHFTQVYLDTPKHVAVADIPYLYAIGMIASPTFVAVSGTVLGLLFVVKRQSFSSLRVKLVDRALFLLTVAHVLIACSRLSYQAHPLDALRMTFMTDTIGICVVAGIFLIDQTSRTTRCVLGVACFALAWRLLYLWTPYETFVELTKEVLIGSTPDHVLPYTVPILPWFGVYITATAFGEFLGDLYRRGNQAGVERALALTGLGVTSLAVAMRCVGWIVEAHPAVDPRSAAYWSMFFSPWSKLPPSPEYVLFFGGLGLIMMAAVTYTSHRARLRWIIAQLAVLGRCSLAVFTVQFYVYFTILPHIRFGPTPLWPLIFLASLASIMLFARWWDARGLNRILTLGVRRVPTLRLNLPRLVGSRAP